MVMRMNEKMTDFQREPVFRLPNSEEIIVPHYIKPHVWVALGNVYWNTLDLLNSRATPTFDFIWTRTWTERKIFKGMHRKISNAELRLLLLASVERD